MSSEKEKQILEAALALFVQFGIRRVTMEDIAKQLAMSKKTLYKYFESKDAMVESLLTMKLEHMGHNFHKVSGDDLLGFEEKLKKLFNFVNTNLKSFNISFVSEIQTSYPELWERLQDFKTKAVHKSFGKVMEEGLKQGFIREDIDPKVLVDMYSATLRAIMIPSYILSTEYSKTDIYQMIIKIYFQGILTAKANKEFKLFES
jgi:AcrR family transcriptional regulator